jgi:hypothetical protein
MIVPDRGGEKSMVRALFFHENRIRLLDMPGRDPLQADRTDRKGAADDLFAGNRWCVICLQAISPLPLSGKLTSMSKRHIALAHMINFYHNCCVQLNLFMIFSMNFLKKNYTDQK